LRYLESALSGNPDDVRYASDYRQAAIRSKDFYRSVQFFEKLACGTSQFRQRHLNFGFAYVLKFPQARAITQEFLANNAHKEFTTAILSQQAGFITRAG